MIPKAFIDTNVFKWAILSKDKIRRRTENEQELLKKEITAIHALVQFAKIGKINLFRNMENDLEKMWSTNFIDNRKIGELLNGINFAYIDPPYYHARVVAGGDLSKEALIKLREHSFDVCQIERFVNIKKALGGNKNADAYHIYNAEVANIEYFITVDKKLLNSSRNQNQISFLIKILYPSECVEKLKQ